MNKKILIVSLFVALILLVPMTSVVGVSDVEEDCGCQVINDVNLVRFDRRLKRFEKLLNMLEMYTNFFSFLNIYNPVIVWKYEDTLNEFSTFKELNEELKTDKIFQDIPFICDVLENYLNNTEEKGKKYCEKAQDAWDAGNEIIGSLYGFLCFIYFRIWSTIKIIGINLRCWDWL